MRKSLAIVLLPAIALGGCTLFGGGRGAETSEVTVRRTSPLVIPSSFVLPPPPGAPVAQPR